MRRINYTDEAQTRIYLSTRMTSTQLLTKISKNIETQTQLSTQKLKNIEPQTHKTPKQLSVVVITFNESANIARCLDSVRNIADEILVVDSYSTDDTVAIAESKGARILQHPFEGYIEQRAYAVAHAEFDFILALDADECVSSELEQELLDLKQNWVFDCYVTNRLNGIGGQWIRYGAWYPDPKMRIFDRRKAICTGTTPHDRIEPVEGASVAKLKGDILHYSDDNIADRIRSVNNLTSASAKYLYTQGKRTNWLIIFFKPLIKFITIYWLRRGFLDGFYGFVIAKSLSQYTYLQQIKLMELQRKNKANENVEKINEG